ncbi:MAG: mechanosensitive ion channel [Chromatiaceae bacterium]|jgi:potassium efflux system protein|nr:mechanosensitive ion channel [Chromatiaceae bacterium]
MRIPRSLPPLWLALLGLLAWGGLLAQDSVPEPSPTALGASERPRLSIDLVESRIAETEAMGELEKALQNRIIEQYRKVVSELKARDGFEEQSRLYMQATTTAPEKAAEIRELSKSAAAAPPPAPPLPQTTIADLEQQLAKAQADAAAVAAKLKEIDKELESAPQQPAAARKRIIEAKSELDKLDADLALPVVEGDSPLLTSARRQAMQARSEALRAEILMLDQQLLSHAARMDLLKAREEKASNDLSQLTAAARQLEDQLNQRRREQAETARAEAQEAERQARDKHPLVQQLAQRNAVLSAELTELTEDLNRMAGQQDQIEAQTRAILEDFRTARQRVELAGLTQALGQVLIDQRNKLPGLRSFRDDAEAREHAIVEASLRQIRLAEERRALRDPAAFVDAYVQKLADLGEREGIRDDLIELAEQRRALLEKAIGTDETYLGMLSDLDDATRQLIHAVTEYDAFLAERLLWVRSSPPVDLATLTGLPRALMWLVDPVNWVELAEALLHELQRSPLFWLQILLVAGLFWKGPALRQRIRATEEHLRRVRTDSIFYTLEATFLTLVLAAAWPLLMAMLGSQLQQSPQATAFGRAAGAAMLDLALALYFLRTFRLLCMKGGVADRHFRWSGEVLAGLRRAFDWLIAVGVPVGLLANLVYGVQDLAYTATLGRLTLIAVMLVLAVFYARVLNPRRGALRELLADNPKGWLNRLRRIWYPLAVGVPLAFAVITALGYLYTTTTLMRSLMSSTYLVLGLIVVHQIILRWVILSRRRLALQAALERRAARAVEEEKANQDVASLLQVDEPVVDLAALDEQTRRLVNMLLFLGGLAGLLLIWAHVLPAFGVFDRVVLWHYTGVVDGTEAMVPVTLRDVALVLLVGAIALVAAQNLPALLEIVLLQRMEISAGGRYAVKTLTGYVIIAAAVLTMFGTLGLSWGQVQWLVAALSVGIGFGLQEIVANFISGLIILFERPVRVGDIVTVGDTTGVVTKIQIRATTIRNYDRQELLVPNKEFITGRLLNWTLSDRVNRVTITVGVDYGADVALALRLLAEAASEHERVLDDPPPLISFEAFGDNALTLVMRCYLDSLDYRLGTITELHLAIYEKLRAAGISIAFPQRDVHLTTAEPLDVRVHAAGEPPDRAAGADTAGVERPGR